MGIIATLPGCNRRKYIPSGEVLELVSLDWNTNSTALCLLYNCILDFSSIKMSINYNINLIGLI